MIDINYFDEKSKLSDHARYTLARLPIHDQLAMTFETSEKLGPHLNKFRVTWKDLIYTVPHRASGRGASKVILNGVSGYFDSGKVTAIMGPSGGGKSTLLACICKQKTIGVSGSITISTDAEVFFQSPQSQ